MLLRMESAESGDSRVTEVIALFGATGRTGRHFLELALNEGYRVQAQVRSPDKIPSELREMENLSIIPGDFSDPDNVKQILEATVSGADYVVCMAGGPLYNSKEYKDDNMMTNFVQNLWPILQEHTPQVFLFQSNAMVSEPVDKIGTSTMELLKEQEKKVDAKEKILKRVTVTRQIVAKVIRTGVSAVGGMKPAITDMENALQYIHDHPLSSTNVIVTRPNRLIEPNKVVREIDNTKQVKTDDDTNSVQDQSNSEARENLDKDDDVKEVSKREGSENEASDTATEVSKSAPRKAWFGWRNQKQQEIKENEGPESKETEKIEETTKTEEVEASEKEQTTEKNDEENETIQEDNRKPPPRASWFGWRNRKPQTDEETSKNEGSETNDTENIITNSKVGIPEKDDPEDDDNSKQINADQDNSFSEEGSVPRSSRFPFLAWNRAKQNQEPNPKPLLSEQEQIQELVDQVVEEIEAEEENIRRSLKMEIAALLQTEKAPITEDNAEGNTEEQREVGAKNHNQENSDEEKESSEGTENPQEGEAPRTTNRNEQEELHEQENAKECERDDNEEGKKEPKDDDANELQESVEGCKEDVDTFGKNDDDSNFQPIEINHDNLQPTASDKEVQSKPNKEEEKPKENVMTQRTKDTAINSYQYQTLMTSYDSPELQPISFRDLASFTLHQFLHDYSLVGKYPYVKIATPAALIAAAQTTSGVATSSTSSTPQRGTTKLLQAIDDEIEKDGDEFLPPKVRDNELDMALIDSLPPDPVFATESTHESHRNTYTMPPLESNFTTHYTASPYLLPGSLFSGNNGTVVDDSSEPSESFGGEDEYKIVATQNKTILSTGENDNDEKNTSDTDEEDLINKIGSQNVLDGAEKDRPDADNLNPEQIGSSKVSKETKEINENINESSKSSEEHGIAEPSDREEVNVEINAPEGKKVVEEEENLTSNPIETEISKTENHPGSEVLDEQYNDESKELIQSEEITENEDHAKNYVNDFSERDDGLADVDASEGKYAVGVEEKNASKPEFSKNENQPDREVVDGQSNEESKHLEQSGEMAENEDDNEDDKNAITDQVDRQKLPWAIVLVQKQYNL